MPLGEVIREERVRRKLTQAELGKKVRVSRQSIAALERGRGRVSTLSAVERTLHLHVMGLTHGSSMVERIQATRLRDGLSLRHVASAASVSVNTVRDIEAGKGSVPSLLAILKALAPNARFTAGATRAQRSGLATVGRRQPSHGSSADYFATPAPVTRLLLEREGFSKRGPILEPAVGGARAIDRVLRENGYETVCLDLHGDGPEQQDFLTLRVRYPSIVTNPPFSLHVQFVQHAKRIAEEKIAMLLPINYLTGAQRLAEIWEDREFPLARVHVLNRGVNFTASDPHADKFLPSQLYVAWFVFDRSHEGSAQISWVDCDPWIERKGNGRLR